MPLQGTDFQSYRVSGLVMPRKSELAIVASQLNAVVDDGLRAQINHIVDTLGSLYKTAYSAYSYFIPGDDILRRNRIQACRAFPLLMATFCGAFPLDRMEEIREAIDRGGELVPAIARRFNVRPNTVRFLAGKPVHVVGDRWLTSLPYLFETLDNLCPEHRPQTAQDWELFGRMEGCLGNLELLGLRSAWLQQFAASGYQTAYDRIIKRYGTWGAMESVHDFVHQLVQYVFDLLDPGLRGMALQLFLEQEFVRIGLFRTLELSEKWHAAARRRADRAKPPRRGKGLAWTSLIEKPWQCGGLIVAPLTSHHDLFREGVLLEHCVEGYVEYCLTGETHLFSIRTPENQPLSTLEIVVEEDDMGNSRFRQAQHAAYRNTTPNGCCLAVADQFTSHLKSVVTEEHLALIRLEALERSESPEFRKYAMRWRGRLGRETLLESVGKQNFECLVVRAKTVI